MLLAILLFAAPLHQACAWVLSVGKLRTGDVALQSLQLSHTADQLALRIGTLQSGRLDLHQQQLAWDCTLQRTARGADARAATSCVGVARAAAPAWRGQLSIDTTASANRVQLRVGKASLQWQAERAPGKLVASQIRLSRVPLAWLQARVMKAWPEMASMAGTADADLSLSPDHNTLAGTLTLQDLAFDTRLGDIAGAGLQLQGALTLRLDAGPDLRWRMLRPRGQLLFGPVYFELPDAESRLEISAAADAQGIWQMPLLDWRDGAGLQVKVAAHTDQAERLDLRVLGLDADLDSAARRYLGSAMATAGFDGLALKGRLAGSGRFVDGAWQQFDLELQDVAVADSSDRIQVERLQGSLHMDTIAAANSLQWQGARLFALPLGNGSAHWQWSPQKIELSEPLSIALLGGNLRLPTLQRLRGDGPSQWLGTIELDQIDLLNLTTALGWPHFSGTLSGRLPGFRFRDGGFTADGDIQLDVFAGKVRVSNFSSERTFGVAPSLGADISFNDLDLKQLSAVLDFGEIEGWLDGEIRSLRMLDWGPVAFDARLHTDPDYPRKKKISQRAVQGLSSVGGGGSALGGPMMKLVDSFGYNQIGLNCLLRDNVCEMSGLDQKDGGYTILRGAGIPRLTVVGHQHRVDWPVLLARLQAVSSGQAPVIE